MELHRRGTQSGAQSEFLLFKRTLATHSPTARAPRLIGALERQPPSLMNLRTLLSVLLLAGSSPTRHVTAQLANQPREALWIEGIDGSGALEGRFEHRGKLLKAILLVASEQTVEVELNENFVARQGGSKEAYSIDVTSGVSEGANVLKLRGTGKIAALLELNGDLARKSWVATGPDWRTPAGPVHSTKIDPEANPFDFKKAFDAYNSWQLAKTGTQSEATGPAAINAPPGFQVERVRSSSGEEGSWVAMAFDSRGRITLAREKCGLLRFDPRTGTMEVIENTLLECRGLLYAGGVLFANANNSKGLYRLRASREDGYFDNKTEILRTGGGVGHGRNHVKLGPDGWLYVAHGNNVLLPENLSTRSALRNYAADQVLPNPWNEAMFDGNVELPAGHVLRVKQDGSEVELLAGGLRNPLDGAFNREGEFFVFDADMERDVGASWYMPTRVLHVVPGADYGWRRGTARQPAWYVDTLPSVVDVGLSSPTGVFFGYGSKFPARYQDALFCLDWAYGRILAITLGPRGASYQGMQETFVSGRPLNVTDGCIGPDGALWFITGGRGTQSGLYRVSWTGAAESASAPQPLAAAQQLRCRIEHGAATDEEVYLALGDEDPFLRHAAVRHMELTGRLPDPETLTRFTAGWAAISRWLVAVRSGQADLRETAMRAAVLMPWDQSATEQRLASLRILAVGMARGGALSDAFADECRTLLEQRFPAREPRLDRELCTLLVALKSPQVIAKATNLLRTVTTSEDLIFYAMQLRYLREGWTTELRRVVFEALNRAEGFNGASAYFKSIADTRSELAAALSPEEAAQLASEIHPPKPVQLLAHALPGHMFKNWRLEDLAPLLGGVSKGRSFEKARVALVSAQCVFCHRVSQDSSIPAGLFGPDLTQVSARFGRLDLLRHILEPSLVIDEKYRSTVLKTVDGRELTGTLESEDDERVVLRTNPLSPALVEIAKAQIRERCVSDVSPMPSGLLNTLKAEQILDLLAWFETAGDASGAAWK